MLFLDGVYIGGPSGSATRFRWVKAPTSNELTQLTHTIAQRSARYLVRQGLLVRDAGNSYLTAHAVDSADDDPMHHLLGHSITYRIAVGPQQGRKVFTLQTLPDCGSDKPGTTAVGEAAEFSLHAGVATKANERAKLERLCRYITRPAVSTKRLSLTRNGQVRYELKTPYSNGTTHVLFEPLDFISRLVALVPKPRVHDLLLQGFGLGNRHTLAHRLFRPVGVASAFVGDRTGKGGEVVLRLLAHVALNILAATRHRVSRTDIGPWRHRRDVCRHGDERAG